MHKNGALVFMPSVFFLICFDFTQKKRRGCFCNNLFFKENKQPINLLF